MSDRKPSESTPADFKEAGASAEASVAGEAAVDAKAIEKQEREAEAHPS